MYSYATNHSLVVCRAKNLRRILNLLSLRPTLCFAKDLTQAAGQGEPWTPYTADTFGGVE